MSPAQRRYVCHPSGNAQPYSRGLRIGLVSLRPSRCLGFGLNSEALDQMNCEWLPVEWQVAITAMNFWIV